MTRPFTFPSSLLDENSLIKQEDEEDQWFLKNSNRIINKKNFPRLFFLSDLKTLLRIGNLDLTLFIKAGEFQGSRKEQSKKKKLNKNEKSETGPKEKAASLIGFNKSTHGSIFKINIPKNFDFDTDTLDIHLRVWGFRFTAEYNNNKNWKFLN